MEDCTLKKIMSSLYKYSIWKYSAKKEDIEDAIQDSYILVKSKLSENQYNNPKILYKFMCSCVKNIIYRKQLQNSKTIYDDGTIDNYMEDLDDSCEYKDFIKELNTFNEIELDILILKESGYNLKEISSLVNINYENLKKKWKKIKEKCKSLPFLSSHLHYISRK